jgi:hypothetical protein
VNASLAGVRQDARTLYRIGDLSKNLGRVSVADRTAIKNVLHTAQALETRVAVLAGDIQAKARENELFAGDKQQLSKSTHCFVVTLIIYEALADLDNPGGYFNSQPSAKRKRGAEAEGGTDSAAVDASPSGIVKQLKKKQKSRTHPGGRHKVREGLQEAQSSGNVGPQLSGAQHRRSGDVSSLVAEQDVPRQPDNQQRPVATAVIGVPRSSDSLEAELRENEAENAGLKAELRERDDTIRRLQSKIAEFEARN